MNDASKVVFAFAAIIIVLIVLISLPIVTIWSMNTLFALDIAYNFWTWLAAFWLTALLTGGVFQKHNK